MMEGMNSLQDWIEESPPGSASRIAAEYGFDLAQIDEALAQTPLERLIHHDQALDLILAVRKAGIEHHGFDPGSAEEA
jgi:hypothetical protein